MIKQMKNLHDFAKSLIIDESGQDLIDYALLAAVLGLGIGAALNGLSNDAKNAFFGVGNALTNDVS
jgi:pilus assembly protein Flp/PilA